MGADIHIYVQYRKKERVGTKYDWWDSFGSNFGSRNYTLFGILAGVRERGLKHSYDPKGLPTFGLSSMCENDLYLYIREEGEELENSCTLEQAKQWGRPIINNGQGKPWKTENPDWHSHSWLTLDELKQAFKWYNRISEGYKLDVEYRALLKAMKELEDGGKNEVVVVFWFDN